MRPLLSRTCRRQRRCWTFSTTRYNTDQYPLPPAFRIKTLSASAQTRGQTRHISSTRYSNVAPSRASETTSSNSRDSTSSNELERRIANLGGRVDIQDVYPRLVKTHDNVIDAANFQQRIAKHVQQLEDDTQEAHHFSQQNVEVYGRVTATRVFGSLIFLKIKSGSSIQSAETDAAQVVLNLSKLQKGDTSLEQAELKEFGKRVRRGDWISAIGNVEKTFSGVWSLFANRIPTIVAPSLHDVPLELTDGETRMRERHVDMLVNADVRDTLYLRHEILQQMRLFFNQQSFVEVSTPLLAPHAGGAVARPFSTTANEFADLPLSLRIAPELWLKRLIVGGMERVYEMGPVFRNEGVDATHNPEFTTCEFYATMMTLPDLMKMTRRLFEKLEQAARKHKVESAPMTFESQRQWHAIDFIPALETAVQNQLPGWQLPPLDDVFGAADSFLATFNKLKLAPPRSPTDARPNIVRLLDALSKHFLEPQTTSSPTFIIHHPEIMSPLAKSFPSPDGRHRISARGEAYVNGQEMVNFYEEENSPFEQRRKFEDQLRLGGEEGESGKAIDESYLKVLEWGMPPTGGWGCGVDRIVMFFAGKARIADVLPFGTLRNVVGLAGKS